MIIAKFTGPGALIAARIATKAMRECGLTVNLWTDAEEGDQMPIEDAVGEKREVLVLQMKFTRPKPKKKRKK